MMDKCLEQDDFCGSTLKGKSGNIISILGHNSLTGNKKKYVVHCSVCSIDEELFPKGSLKCNKYKLLSGCSPCGCNGKYKWSIVQREVLIRRRCDKTGYIFIAFERKQKGAFTKIKLYNPVTRNHSLTVRDDEARVSIFKGTGKFPEGSTFTRSSLKDKRGESCIWEYTCPTCSEDKYVKAGVCTGVFLSTNNALKLGKLPCRCTIGKGYTKPQRGFDILEKLKECSGLFRGWIGKYTNGKDSKFKWCCKEGHDNITKVAPFLGGTRCRVCSYLAKSCGNGHYEDREEEEDYLYIVLPRDGVVPLDYFKVGRSFSPNKRLYGLKSVAKLDFEIHKLYKGTHKQVYAVEQELIGKGNNSLFDQHRPIDVVWSSELINIDCLVRVIKYIDESELKEEDN